MRRRLPIDLGVAGGGNVMKTKLIFTIIVILAVVFLSTPAWANTYGNRSGDHFGDGRYDHHFNGDRYGHYFGGERINGYSGYHRPRHFYGYHGYHRHRHHRYPFYFHLGWLFWSPPPPIYIYREYPRTIIYRDKYIYDSRPEDYSGSDNRRPANLKPCLQTREYTTTIIIEGKTVEAYGNRCLQPDGSWRYGPARPVPDI